MLPEGKLLSKSREKNRLKFFQRSNAITNRNPWEELKRKESQETKCSADYIAKDSEFIEKSSKMLMQITILHKRPSEAGGDLSGQRLFTDRAENDR